MDISKVKTTQISVSTIGKAENVESKKESQNFDFEKSDENEMVNALKEYQNRNRRFGGNSK